MGKPARYRWGVLSSVVLGVPVLADVRRQGCYNRAARHAQHLLRPLQHLLIVFAGWVHRQQLDVIDYLQEENRVLRELLGDKPLRFTDAQRRRLAEKARRLGRKVLNDIASIVTPDTLTLRAPPGWRRVVRWAACLTRSVTRGLRNRYVYLGGRRTGGLGPRGRGNDFR